MMRDCVRRWAFPALIVTLGVVTGLGCPGQPVAVAPVNPPKAGPGSIGVVVLVDTSGSMKDAPRDKSAGGRAKHVLANEALAEVLRQTAEWAKANPDKPLNLSIGSFSDRVRPALVMGQFDDAKAQQAVKAIPDPNGGTAIGKGLKEAWDTLKPLGCERQFILCITDGENTLDPRPETVVPTIHKDSGGKVEIHFIAFDVNAHLFDFLKEYNGHVVEAANHEKLNAELQRIFRKRILLGEGDD